MFYLWSVRALVVNGMRHQLYTSGLQKEKTFDRFSVVRPDPKWCGGVGLVRNRSIKVFKTPPSYVFEQNSDFLEPTLLSRLNRERILKNSSTGNRPNQHHHHDISPGQE